MRRHAAVATALLLAAAACASGDASPPAISEGYVAAPDGARIYYKSVGQGEQTVIVPFALFLADPLASLGQGRRVVFFDPPGRGKSDPIDTLQVSIDRNVEYLESLRAALGVERFALIGWSGFGKEAAIYTVRYPTRVTRLVQMSPVPPSPDEYPAEPGIRPRDERMDVPALTRLMERQVDGEFAGRSAEFCREVNRLTQPANFADTSLASQVPDVCDSANEWPENLWPYFGAIMASQGTQDWRDSIRAVGIPRLVIHGVQDPIPIAGGRAWAAGDPNARFLALSPGGHFIFIEQREAVLAAIEDFLAGRWPVDAVPVPAPDTPI